MGALGHFYAAVGKKDEARAVLAELQQLSNQQYVPADAIAITYAGLGEKEQVFAWLEKAYQEHAFKWLGSKSCRDGIACAPIRVSRSSFNVSACS